MIDQGTGTLAHARGASNLASRARGGGGRTIVHLAAEYYPYARTGGLAEAVAGLAEQQARDGEAVVVFMPLYPSARATAGDLQPVGPSLVVPLGELREPVRFLRDAARTHGPEVVFIDAPGYFARSGLYGEDGQDYADNHRRFALFSRAALDGIRAAVPGPVLVHAHDWHAAFAPIFMRTSADLVPAFVDAPAILSVHNAGYQGHFPPSAMADLQLPPELWTMDRLEWFGRLNVLKGGIVYADLVVTVSPSHAEELCTPEGGFGLDELFRALGPRLVGITNGIDQSVWSPATDPEIAANYTAHDLRGKGECRAALQRRFGLIPDPSAPIFGMSSRLVKQKGFDLLLQSEFVQRGPAQFAILGMGDPGYHVALRALADALPGRVAVEFRFTEALEHVVIAGADMVLMPSLYEPCGLTQMRAQRYGDPVVGRCVGGIRDTVMDGVTGFLFEDYAPAALDRALDRACRVMHDPRAWHRMMQAAMATNFSWERSAVAYRAAYAAVTAPRAAA